MSSASSSSNPTATPSSSSSSSSHILPLPSVANSQPIYFEHQKWSRCALHALNNLLQSSCFTSATLDSICSNLSPSRFFNPHRSIFGIGNYDINVIMSALSRYGLQCRWFDRRKGVESIIAKQDDLFGLIVNIPSHTMSAFGSRHWICLRRFDEKGGAAASVAASSASTSSSPSSSPSVWYQFDSDDPEVKEKSAAPSKKAKRIDDLASHLAALIELPLAASATSSSSTAAPAAASSKSDIQLFLIEFDSSAALDAAKSSNGVEDAAASAASINATSNR